MRNTLRQLIIISALILGSYYFPHYDGDDDHQMLNTFLTDLGSLRNSSNHKSIPFPVMTFNVRLDMEESDPNNHFKARVSRIGKVVSDWQPYIIGVQEPFNGQLMDITRSLPSRYKVVGYRRSGLTHEYQDMGKPFRTNDYQTAILYDSDHLELVHENHIWLSKTPQIEGSKDWKSMGKRTLTIGRFGIKENNDGPTRHVIIFNTHLDVKSEIARQEQSKIVIRTIDEYRVKYPHDPVILLGDFNSVPGHKSYQILTDRLRDAWIDCKSDSEQCTSQNFASTFHGWLGSKTNSYIARILQYILHTFHGSGVEMPHRFPTWTEVVNVISSIKIQNLKNGLPMDLSRLHVDWILYQQSLSVNPSKENGNLQTNPLLKDGESFLRARLACVADVRSTNYSSDHFPVVALFELITK